MSWREDLGRVEFPAAGGARRRLIGATFRGVPFFVEASERSGGRRGVTHEYPLRDEPFREDLGRDTRGFSIEGYVCGDDYLAQRDRLLDALEAYGPGTLVHPYYGTLTVAVKSFRVRDSRDDGGLAKFSVEFEQTPEAPAQPTATPNAAGAARASAGVARAAVSAEFLARYAPGLHTASLADAFRRAALAADRAVARVRLGTQEAAAMRRRLDGMVSSASSLAAVPAEALDSFVGLFESFGAGALQAVLAVYGFTPGVRPSATTPNRRREQLNFDALRWLVQRLVVVRAAELVLDEAFSTYEEAVGARESVTALLDEQAEVVADDVYPSLVQLRADVVKAVPGPDGDLPRLLPFTPSSTVPSLVLTYQLYGALALEADVIARNRVRNPGFVAGGQPLQVLSNG